MEKKKVLYVINSLKQTGPNRVLENMISGIDKSIYDVYVLSFLNTDFQNSIENVKKLGAKYICLNLKKKIDIVTIGNIKIKNIVKEIKPNIVHSHGILSDIAVSNLKNVLKITTVHSNLKEDYKYTFGNIKGYIYNLLHRYYLKKFDKVVCCSKSVYDALNVNNRNNKYTFVRNGIRNVSNEKVYGELRKELNIKETDTVYLYVGALSDIKNIKTLTERFAELIKDDEHFIILGTGKYFDELKKMESTKIHVLGFKENPEEYMKISDIYISASLSEGLSISIIEALDNDMLLLLSNIDSHKEIFTIDSSFYLGEIFDFDNFSEKLNKIRAHVGKNNNVKKFKEKYLSDKVMMKEYTEFYEEK